MQATHCHSLLRDLTQFGLDPHDWIEKQAPARPRSAAIQDIEFAHRDDNEIRLVGAASKATRTAHRQILYLELHMNSAEM